MAVSLVASSIELQAEAAQRQGHLNVFAASLESPFGNDLGDPTHLIASPYTTAAHLLDLRTLDASNQLLARALTRLLATRADYATASYLDSFNWEEVMSHLRLLIEEHRHKWNPQHFYIVVFRSQIVDESVRARLGALDQAAHGEAMASGGFLKYWFGVPDMNGRNLATCVWRSCHDARVGSIGPEHLRAANAARKSYHEWRIERWRLDIGDGAKQWSIEPWVD